MTDQCSPGSELLPCPFCGADGPSTADTGVYWIRCTSCMAEGAPFDTEAEAIAFWNRRAAAQTTNIADLIKMLDLHVDGVRHYLHLQIGKPLSKHLISAPEIALDNLHREIKAALSSTERRDG